MGCVGSTNEDSQHTIVHDPHNGAVVPQLVTHIQDDNIESPRGIDGSFKILLLGTTNSGKTTLFKQLFQLYANGFDDNMRGQYVDRIYSQVIEELKVVIQIHQEDNGRTYHRLSETGRLAVNIVNFTRGDVDIDRDLAQQIKIVWAEKGIKEVFQENAGKEHAIHESTQHFFDDIIRIGRKSYIPTDLDMLYIAHQTRGDDQVKFKFGGDAYHFVDLGGNREERKKWIHQYDNVRAVVFTVSLVSYRDLGDDGRETAIADSLACYEEVINSRWFENTPVVLLFTKADIFKSEIKYGDIGVAFPEYDPNRDGAEPPAQLRYIQKQFEMRQQRERPGDIQHICSLFDKKFVAQAIFPDLAISCKANALNRM